MVGRTVTLFPKATTPVGDVLLEVERPDRAGELPTTSASRSARRDRRAWPAWSAPAAPRSRASCSASTSATPARSGSTASPSASPPVARRWTPGIAYLPEDRHQQGLVLDFSIAAEHHAADPAAPLPAAARPSHRPSATVADELHGAVQRPDDRRRPAGRRRCRAATSRRSCWPSGWRRSRRVLILDEPTRGIDIGAKVEVHRIISELAASGLGDHPHLERPARGPRDLVSMSMPRVGSSRIRTRGFDASHLASTTFCWLPPDSAPTELVDAGHPDVELLACTRRRPRAPSAARSSKPREEPRQDRQGDVLGDREVEDQALLVAVLGQVGDARRPSPPTGSRS